MAKCEHNFEPSDQCVLCEKERNIMQFGGVWSGEVGLNQQPKPRTKLGRNEARFENAERDEAERDAMKEYILKSFSNEPNIESDKDVV
tara:strand:- start:15607 stop:15870 length:264 start_codon:yes stop_codon:yes gene_type:complete